jgi:hypothetical protein
MPVIAADAMKATAKMASEIVCVGREELITDGTSLDVESDSQYRK